MSAKLLFQCPEELRDRIGDEAARVAQRPNVLFVTVGEKRIAGRPTGRQALVAYVREKKEVSKEVQIPKRIKVKQNGNGRKSLPTDVVPLLGQSRLLGIEAGNIILSGDTQNWGTCCLSFSKNGRSYVSTNAHVVANLEKHTLPDANPAVQDPSTQQFFSTGPVVYISPFPLGQATQEDYAVVWTQNLKTDALAILNYPIRISRFGRIKQNLTDTYWYASNGAFMQCVRPELHVAPPASMTTGGATLRYENFWVFTMTQGTAEHGHSGSVVCRGSGSDVEACGILFGGSGPNYAYVFDLEPIYNKAFATLP